MKKLINHILVPVNFNSNTELVMVKAIQAANQFNSDIHLLYVQTGMLSIPFVYDGHFSGAIYNVSAEEAEKKMKKLIEEYQHLLNDGLFMTTKISAGNWCFIIKEQVIIKHIDLIILPRTGKKAEGALLYKVNVNQLAQQTQCPILTVTKNFNIDHLQNIVVPLDDFLPIRKLTAATYLAKKFNGAIHLMGRKGQSAADDRKKSRCLTRAYQLLRDYTSVKVHCSVQDGYAVADDTLAYAKNIHADLIVVNTGKESRLKGWFSKWMGNYLYKESSIPVLTMAPQS